MHGAGIGYYTGAPSTASFFQDEIKFNKHLLIISDHGINNKMCLKWKRKLVNL